MKEQPTPEQSRTYSWVMKSTIAAILIILLALLVRRGQRHEEVVEATAPAASNAWGTVPEEAPQPEVFIAAKPAESNEIRFKVEIVGMASQPPLPPTPPYAVARGKMIAAEDAERAKQAQQNQQVGQ